MTLNAGIVSIPESRIISFICWFPRKVAGTQKLQSNIGNITQHISAMTEIVNILYMTSQIFADAKC